MTSRISCCLFLRLSLYFIVLYDTYLRFSVSILDESNCFEFDNDYLCFFPIVDTLLFKLVIDEISNCL